MSSIENSSCEQVIDAAPYVLRALEEAEAYREHLSGCATCQAQVAELQQVVDRLPESTPAMAAPEALRGRVLATVRSEAELFRAASRPTEEPPKLARRLRSRGKPYLGASIALAAVLGAAVVIALGGGSSTHVRVTSAHLAASLPGAHASLRQVENHAELVISGMPRPALGKIYELWLKRGTAAPQPTDALFSVTSRGTAAVAVPESLHGVKELMVTSEPLGGSSRPSGPALIRIPIST
ncbi:MAG TPA: anti-sigma factor [Solirubrobacteraceae bacterium]